MENIQKEIIREEKAAMRFFSKPTVWIITSAVLLILVLALVFWPSGMSGEKASKVLVDNLNEKTGGGVTFNAVKDLGNIYEVTVTYKEQEIPVYITKDGKYIVYQTEEVGAAATLPSQDGAQPAASQDVPKTDKPVVEAFVFTYCPYGLQFQKALAPVYDLLGDKADINLVQIGAMHGEYEKIEALRQLCIQDNYGKDKLWAYLNKFMGNTSIGSCSGDSACLTPLLDPLMESLSIDADKIADCMDNDAEALYSADGARASSLGISGSPTFVINGVEVQVGRTPEAIKTAICGAFTTAPSECDTVLSSSAMTPGFGYAAGASTGATC